MKKFYLYLLSLTAAVLMSTGLSHAQQRVLEEGFENTQAGMLPEGWTQLPEQGTKNWMVEVDDGQLVDPKSPAEGKAHVKLVDRNGGGTERAIKLVTPAFNTQSLAEPILVFSHVAIEHAGNVVDSLYVYYRLQEGYPWMLAGSFGANDFWQTDTIDFGPKSRTFQLAFEGVNNSARGVAIDNIQFTSRPTCEAPTDVTVYNILHNEAKFRWNGPLTFQYLLKVFETEQADPATAEAVFELPVLYNTNAFFRGDRVKPATEYYWYLRADAGYGDTSPWVSGTFRTACEPVQSFSTSFDTPEDIVCWATMQQGFGDFATRWADEGGAPAPTNETSVRRNNGYRDDGSIIWRDFPDPQPRTGASALHFNVMSESAADYNKLYAVSPRLADDVDLTKMQISFWARSNSQQLHLRLMVTDLPDDFSKAEAAGEVVLKTTNTYERFTLMFDESQAKGKYIVFMVDGGEEYASIQNPQIDIDDIVLEEKEDCSNETKVALFTRPVTTDETVTLSWNASGVKTWNVKVSTVSINPAVDAGNLYDGQVTETPTKSVNKLTPGTRYYYYVQPVCQDGVKGAWCNEQFFDTQCVADGLEMPFRENFDKYKIGNAANSGLLPPCWTAKSDGQVIGIETSEQAYTPYGHIVTYSSLNGYLFTPKLNAKLNQCQVRFALCAESLELPFEVYVLDDPNDPSTYVKIEECYPDKIRSYNNYNWKVFTVSLESYEGNGQYIGFKYPDKVYGCGIDDVVVEPLAACADPAEFTVTGTDINAISVAWKATGDESEWDIAYCKAGGILGKNTEEVHVTAPEHTLTGLTENTAYDLYLRSDCGGDDKKGRWIGPLQARTIAPAKAPYECTFEDAAMAGAWQLLNGTQVNQWIIGDALKDENGGTGNTLFISDTYGTSNHFSLSTTYAYACRLFEFETGTFDFEFDWRLDGWWEVVETSWWGQIYTSITNNAALIPFLVPEHIEIQAGNPGPLQHINFSGSSEAEMKLLVRQGANCVPDGWIPLSDTILSAKGGDWHHFKKTIQVKQQGRYRLVLAMVIDNNGNNELPAAAVDNVKVNRNTTYCLPVEDMRIFNVRTDRAQVEFNSYNATKWDVIVTDREYTEAELDAVTAVGENVVFMETQNAPLPLNVSGLTPETHYWVAVRPNCDNDVDWVSTDFFTICEAKNIPLTEDFENPTALLFLDCWRRLPVMDPYTDYTGKLKCQNPYVDFIETISSDDKACAANNLTRVLHMQEARVSNGVSHEGYVVTPELNADVKTLQMSFRATAVQDYARLPFTLEVGVMDDPVDTATFTLVESVKLKYAAQWKTYMVYFDEYKGTGKHIAIRQRLMNNSSSSYIDDLKIEVISGCTPAREITVSNITGSSADLEWRILTDPTDYHVKVFTRAMGRWEETGDVFDGIVRGTNKHQLTGLRGAKQYYVYVRTVCEETPDGIEYSSGISETVFRTGCPEREILPFTENFDNYELNEYPACWATIGRGPVPYTANGSYRLESDPSIILKPQGRFMLMVQSTDHLPGIVVLPEMEEKLQDLTLTFDGAKIGVGGNLIAGVVSDLNDPNSFTPVDTAAPPTYNEWATFRVDMSKYKGEGNRIAFYLAPAWNGDVYVIDNILVRKTTMTCPDAVAPQALNVGTDVATLRWADNDVNHFELKVADHEINPEVDEGNVINAERRDETSTTLTALKPNTVYYAYIRNVCDDGSYGYWSSAVTFRTLCDDLLSASSYFEDFSGYGEIADNGFFPECWRNRVQIYGGISPSEQVAPYIENASVKSMLMKAVYASNTNDYAVVDVATPVITFDEGKNLTDHYMTLRVQSSDVNGKLYVGVMSDPADGSTFVAYDTLSVSEANVWEDKLVNFLYVPSPEAHIAFRVNSLDAQATYQAKFTDIRLHALPDCMPPYKINADVRPDKAFINWLPGDKKNKEWKYYYSDSYSKMTIPFTDEEWETNNASAKVKASGTTSDPRLTINGLQANKTYNFYIKNTACDEFYPMAVSMRPESCSDLANTDLPYYEDFSNYGTGYTEAEPQYSAYPDCWARTDSDETDPVAYPYIDAENSLYFVSVADGYAAAYLPAMRKNDMTIDIAETQLRFTAKGATENDSILVGLSGYTTDWSTPSGTKVYNVFFPIDTVALSTEWAEYTVEFSDFVIDPADKSEGYAVTLRSEGAHAGYVQELSYEGIPYCLTPAPRLLSVDKDMLSIDWSRLEDQSNWEVAIGKAGFDPDMADAEPRIDTTYRTMGLDEGTAYELYVHALCGNGLTSDWAKLAVTTRQTPAVYPYSSTDLGDGTHLVADTVNYAYRTIDFPAGPHILSFDYQLADNAGSYLRVFLVPETEMITTQSDFGMTVDAIPAGWTELATYNTATQWTSVSSKLQVPYGTEEACNVVFVWTKTGDDLTAVIRNIDIKASNECTVPEALAARQVTATSAVLTWVSYNANQYAVFYGQGTVTSETGFSDDPYLEITGLEPDTEYCFQVQATCGTGDLSEKVTFRTACAPVDALVENFDNGLDNCWKTYHGLVDEVVADPNKLQLQAGGWTLTDRELIDGSKSQHAQLTVEGTDCAWWLISPAVKLTETSGLSFDLALTAYNAQSGIQNVYGQADDRFMVLISVDEGRTWSEADATEWNNKKNNKKCFNRISNEYQRMEVDLSPYTGKTVRIAFYGESTVELESNDIHIDNIGIECRTVMPTIDAHACTGYPYEGNGFRITREDNDHTGVFNYTRREDNPNGCAFTYNLRLTVGQSYEVNYDRSICQGDNYSDDTFTLTYDAGTKAYTTTDKQVVVNGNAYTKIYSAKNGCDSVVTMYLTVNPSYELDESMTIKREQLPYKFACYEIKPDAKSGRVKIECQTVNGCDSIIHLDLTIIGGDGLDEAYGNMQFTLSPNPVERGKQLTVQREFSPAELQGMEITVVNSLGMECSRIRPVSSQVSIPAPEVSGVYMVRIVTGTKQTLTSRFIVK